MIAAYNTIINKKSQLKAWQVLPLAFLAGVFLSFAGMAATLVQNAVGGSMGIIAKAVVFPAGLIMIVLAGAELFTGDCTLIVGAMDNKISANKAFEVLGTAYLGNLIGSIIVASLTHNLFTTSIKPLNMSYLDQVFALAILCNMLVCLAVLLSAKEENAFSKCIVIFIPIFIFVVCGMEHSIANMYYLSVDLYNNFSWHGLGNAFIWLIITTLGNIFGALLLTMPLSLSDKNIKEQN